MMSFFLKPQIQETLKGHLKSLSNDSTDSYCDKRPIKKKKAMKVVVVVSSTWVV